MGYIGYALMFFYLLSLLLMATCIMFKYALHRKRSRLHTVHLTKFPSSPLTILGFFHPYCNAGGGGERVLWCALRTLDQLIRSKQLPPTRHYKVVIYTGDLVDPIAGAVCVERILERATERFNIKIPVAQLALEFIPLRSRPWLADTSYKSFTLLNQSLGSILVGAEALWRYPPDIFIDTTGFAFTYYLAKLGLQAKVAAYVHYPTISTDMIHAIALPSFNNASDIAASPIKMTLKTVYYQLFAKFYGLVGHYCCDVVMVNSTWTARHIQALWHSPVTVVYPPCDTLALTDGVNVKSSSRKPWLVSIAQFRPEKNHALQIRAFASLLSSSPSLFESHPTWRATDMRLVLMGSCRGPEDHARVDVLKQLCCDLNIVPQVDFILNAPYSVLCHTLKTSTIGLHTMSEEHFGIGVVEMLAAGLLTIAHRSGGPLEDIIVSTDTDHATGFLAKTQDDYVGCMRNALALTSQEASALRTRAMASVTRFSDATFEHSFGRAMVRLVEA